MSLSAANAKIFLTIPGIFSTPQQLQGFGADDVFDTESVESTETVMGVDGRLSGGYVNVAVRQGYTLMADSPSIIIFDQWYYAQKTEQDTFIANGVILLTTLGKKWAMTRGFLKGYKPLPDAKKLLQAQKFQIEWEGVSPAAS